VSSKTEIQLKNGKGSKPKRNVTLVDQSGKQVTLTLWDYLADEVLESHAAAHDVVAIRSLRVTDYNGCSLNTSRSSVIQINPELDETTALKEWYSSDGSKASFTSVSTGGGGAGGGGGAAPRKYISDIEKEKLGMGEKPSYFELRCSITYATATQESAEGKKRTWQYPSNPENKKKVVQDGSGWRDESNNTYMDKCQRRYISAFKFSDLTSSVFMTMFDDECQKVLGMNADEAYELEESNADAFKALFQNALFSEHLVKVRAKSEVWEGETRVKCQVVGLKPLDYAQESKALLERIRNYGI